MQLATEQGSSLATTAERESVREIQKKQCHVSLDHDTELKSTADIDQDKTYVFPDEHIVTVALNVSVSRKCRLSHTVPIYESYTLQHANLRVAGRDLAEFFMKNHPEQGYSFTAAAERVMARDVKEKLCYIGVDDDTEHKPTAEMKKKKTYELPDRNIISVGAERAHCVDILFQPSFIGKETSGCHDTSFQIIMMRDIDIRKKCMPMSCSQVARSFSNRWLSA